MLGLRVGDSSVKSLRGMRGSLMRALSFLRVACYVCRINYSSGTAAFSCLRATGGCVFLFGLRPPGSPPRDLLDSEPVISSKRVHDLSYLDAVQEVRRAWLNGGDGPGQRFYVVQR